MRNVGIASLLQSVFLITRNTEELSGYRAPGENTMRVRCGNSLPDCSPRTKSATGDCEARAMAGSPAPDVLRIFADQPRVSPPASFWSHFVAYVPAVPFPLSSLQRHLNPGNRRRRKLMYQGPSSLNGNLRLHRFNTARRFEAVMRVNIPGREHHSLD